MMNKQNRNMETTLNWHYIDQQRTIKDICAELGLIPYYPNYHAQDKDCNTVMIYTKEAYDYNKKLEEKWHKYGMHPLEYEYKHYICWLENTDANHHFSYDFMNGGKIDLRSIHYKAKIKDYIIEQHNKSAVIMK